MRIDIDNAGSNQIFLLCNQSLDSKGTFIWNDKFVIAGTDELGVYAESASRNYDVYCTYIDQHFGADWRSLLTKQPLMPYCA